MQYLTQEGYLETARAFASETYEENLALNLDATKPVHRAVVEEDQDAGHRQCKSEVMTRLWLIVLGIRTAILEGDVDRALTLLDTYFPSVLRDNENIAFRLKCRKFIEMIRQGAVMQQASSPTTLTKKGIKQSSYPRNGSWNGDDGNRDVDMDGRVPQQDYADRMDTDDVSGSQYVYQVLLQDTLAYGQALQSEFRDDPRKEVTQALNDAFSLMAYQDPLGTKEVSHMLDSRVRTVVAEEVNTAILRKSPAST